TAVTPTQGTMGATVPVTIDGSGVLNGATVTAGGGDTVDHITIVSPAPPSASFLIPRATPPGGPGAGVVDPGGGGGALCHRIHRQHSCDDDVDVQRQAAGQGRPGRHRART